MVDADKSIFQKKSAFSPALGAGTSVCENRGPKFTVSGRLFLILFFDFIAPIVGSL
jgi:hypothetical protein